MLSCEWYCLFVFHLVLIICFFFFSIVMKRMARNSPKNLIFLVNLRLSNTICFLFYFCFFLLLLLFQRQKNCFCRFLIHELVRKSHLVYMRVSNSKENKAQKMNTQKVHATFSTNNMRQKYSKTATAKL